MTSFRVTSAFTPLSLITLLVGLAGCSAESGAASPAATSESARVSENATVVQTASSSPSRAPGGDPHRGGSELLLRVALRESINLTAAQKARIESALAATQERGAHPFDGSRTRALASEIRAGKVEGVSLGGATDAEREAERDVHQAALAKALDTLHITLTADQRKLVVDAIARHEAERTGDASAVPGDASCPPGDDPADGPPPRGPLDSRDPLGQLLEGLDLTATQHATIHAQLDTLRPPRPSDAERAAMQSQHTAFHVAMQAKLQGFVSEAFDANAFVAPRDWGDKGPRGDGKGDSFVRDLAVIVPVWEPAQREKLAARIEAGPTSR